MQKIKNIIFDLGGIFIAVDYLKTQNAFVDLGVANFSQLFAHNTASPLFELLETGKVTPEEFYVLFRQASGTELSDEQIRTAWNAMLGNFYTEAFDWLEDIKERYNIYLFSNTNKIHEDAFNIMLKEQTGYDNLRHFFIKDYYSHTLGLRKPYPESFQAILKEQSLNPAETMFIDDSLKNVEGAIAAGIHGVYLEPPRKVIALQL